MNTQNNTKTQTVHQYQKTQKQKTELQRNDLY